jgi:hypothetical protein
LDVLSSDKLASAIANSGEKIASVIAAADEFQREAARLQSRAIRPFFLAPAPPLRRRRSWIVVMGGIVMLMVAVVVGVVAVGQWSFPALWQQAGDRPIDFASSRVFRVAALRLLVQASPATSGEPAPLGLTLQGRADDAVVMITGLVAGMTLSTGSQIDIDTWRIPTAALPSTWIGPPTNFVGVVDLVAELHLADMTIADRRPNKLEWGAAIPAAAAESPKVETDRTAVAPPSEQNVAPSRQLDAGEPTVETDRTAVERAAEHLSPSRQLDADEIVALLKRGEDLIRSGDLAAARLVLQRAAEAKSAEAGRSAHPTGRGLELTKPARPRFRRDPSSSLAAERSLEQPGCPAKQSCPPPDRGGDDHPVRARQEA